MSGGRPDANQQPALRARSCVRACARRDHKRTPMPHTHVAVSALMCSISAATGWAARRRASDTDDSHHSMRADAGLRVCASRLATTRRIGGCARLYQTCVCALSAVCRCVCARGTLLHCGGHNTGACGVRVWPLPVGVRRGAAAALVMNRARVVPRGLRPWFVLVLRHASRVRVPARRVCRMQVLAAAC